MKLQMIRNVLVVCTVVMSGCGTETLKKENREPTPPIAQKESEKDQCEKIGGTFQNEECKIPAPKNPEEQCKERGSEYEWKNETCTEIEIPNLALTGELSPNPGVIWIADRIRCDRTTTTQGDRFQTCAGIDVTVPVATLESGISETTLRLSFQCESLHPTNVELTLVGTSISGSSNTAEDITVNQALGVGKSDFVWHGTASAENKPVLKLKMNRGGFFDVFKPDCKIELIENSAIAL